MTPHGGGLPNDTKMTVNDDQDIRRSLARAFDRAWGRYYRSGRLTVGEDVARTALARRLVQLSKEGGRRTLSRSRPKSSASPAGQRRENRTVGRLPAKPTALIPR